MSAQVNEIYDFWKKYGYYHNFDEKDIQLIICKHLEYNTIEVVKIKDKVVALGRYNVDGTTAVILDTVIHPDYRNRKIMHLMLLRGWKKYPFLTKISFERGLRSTITKEYDMARFLGLPKKETNG